MPFVARKRMKWGPGRTPVQLEPGDEVPLPIKKVLIQSRHVVLADSVSGILWADRPEDVRRAWAECNGISYLSEQRQGEDAPVEVASKSHPSRLVSAESEAPPVPPMRSEARSNPAVPPPSIEVESEAKPIAEPIEEVKPKRKRGRPRKVKAD